MISKAMRWFALLVAVSLVPLVTAKAETIRIVALGASNAAGTGVGSEAAWPAQLEKMLRAKGYDVSVAVNAVSGDGSAGYLSRADAAAEGARVVVYDAGNYNDRRTGVSPAVAEANLAQIDVHIRAHGALPIHIRRDSAVPTLDGIHPTARGHAILAGYALPRVIAAIGKPK
jgi:acyl-CoA thioesterase-1